MPTADHTTDSPEDLFRIRKQPKQVRSKATVAALLEAAAQVLIEKGYADANTKLIAKRAGVSIGSLYEYFPGKEAVYAELRRREGLKHYARLTAEPRPETPKQMLRHLVQTHIAQIRDNLPLHVALEDEVPRFAVAETEEAVLAEYVPLSNAFLASFRAQLQPENSIEFVTEFLMRTFSATINDYAMRSPKRLEDSELADAMVQMLGSYLLKPEFR